jgi:2-(3-amino-3-carboxypropyl)histidine synthase
LGIAAATKKTVLFLNLESGKIENLEQEKDRLIRIRFANIEKAKDCKRFGILVSTKPGQSNIESAEQAKIKLKEKGKHAWIIAMDQITPEKLLGLKLDCLVSSACPRLREDSSQFRKPIIGTEDIDSL